MLPSTSLCKSYTWLNSARPLSVLVHHFTPLRTHWRPYLRSFPVSRISELGNMCMCTPPGSCKGSLVWLFLTARPSGTYDRTSPSTSSLVFDTCWCFKISAHLSSEKQNIVCCFDLHSYGFERAYWPWNFLPFGQGIIFSISYFSFC